MIDECITVYHPNITHVVQIKPEMDTNVARSISLLATGQRG